MFLDEVKILITSGKGGDGIVHFRREKYVPHGGPDGGDGGDGGNVMVEALSTLSTLSKFGHQKRFEAQDGRRGGGSNKTGKRGKDVVIQVPCGTIIYDEESGDILADLVDHGERIIIARGGRAGKGNARFATSRNRAPRMAERGEPGIEQWLKLELRLIADVGIVGLPNAGKSTLLAAVTNARPKIAAYPFTTLQPNLGVADLDVDAQLILADIPGLIEGAHEGVGMGFAFLRHIQRTRVLIHVIDGYALDPVADFSQVNAELALFDECLTEKPQFVAVNKMDLPGVTDMWPEIQKEFKNLGYEAFDISALTRTGLKPLLWAAYHAREKVIVEPSDDEIPVYRLEDDPDVFEITREEDGAWRVVGKAVERAAAMTYWEFDEAVRRFQRILEHLGVEEALKSAGAQSGDTVRIGEYELEWQD